MWNNRGFRLVLQRFRIHPFRSTPTAPSSNGSLIVNLTQKVQFPLRQYFILTCSKSIIVKFFGIKFEILSDTIKNRLRILDQSRDREIEFPSTLPEKSSCKNSAKRSSNSVSHSLDADP
ncbi:hypothetical protein LEP1GSC005_0026 [Leptospira santarosai str. ST188]|nr:hypothetical protein LEP1GSC005_0026 [Leptospira santarosai str. ST188]